MLVSGRSISISNLKLIWIIMKTKHCMFDLLYIYLLNVFTCYDSDHMHSLDTSTSITSYQQFVLSLEIIVYHRINSIFPNVLKSIKLQNIRENLTIFMTLFVVQRFSLYSFKINYFRIYLKTQFCVRFVKKIIQKLFHELSTFFMCQTQPQKKFFAFSSSHNDRNKRIQSR